MATTSNSRHHKENDDGRDGSVEDRKVDPMSDEQKCPVSPVPDGTNDHAATTPEFLHSTFTSRNTYEF